MAETSSNSRIARNAVMLYLRMLITMVVGLYTSRVVLNTLGVEDYGTYGVVGGVVAMMGFLNASMSGATSRFLTFELGRGNQERLARTFSSALIAHVIIALVVIVLAETVGLWFVLNKLVIPPGRETAAMWVYQLSVLSVLFGFTQVPYNASIIAHEKMDVYAYVEILKVTLKLLIVYLLQVGNFDKLILYATLTFAVSLIIMMVYRIYCVRRFPETHFHWVWDTSILKPLASFSGWDLYGNMSVTARQQGTNFLQNMYFGVAINAAASITTTVNGVLNGLVHNVIQAFRPSIIKFYARGDVAGMQELMLKAIKYTLALFIVLSIPIYFEIPYMLWLWLGIVPDHTCAFIRILLFQTILGDINAVVTIAIHATGNIKRISMITGSLYLLCLLPTWILFRYFDFPTETAYVVNLIGAMCILASNCLILRKQVPAFSSFRKIASIISLNVLAVVICASAVFAIQSWMPEQSFVRLVIVTASEAALFLILFYTVILSRGERTAINQKISKLFKHA